MVAEQLLQTPFYLDWRFWSTVVAFLALVLSQLPPLHILFRRAKLDAEAHSQMHITHKIGNPHAQLHLILNNTGGRELRIRAIELHFKRGNEDNFVLPAKNYFQSAWRQRDCVVYLFQIKAW